MFDLKNMLGISSGMTLKRKGIYRYGDNEVVFIEFDIKKMKAYVHDMSGNYFLVDIWELKERDEVESR
jgi:hypothetical protein